MSARRHKWSAPVPDGTAATIRTCQTCFVRHVSNSRTSYYARTDLLLKKGQVPPCDPAEAARMFREASHAAVLRLAWLGVGR